MSIVSSGRKSGISFKSDKQKVVRFQLAYNLKSLLSDSLNEKGQKVYEELVCTIRDAGQGIKDYDLLQLLKEARGCISILDENVRLFVQVLLIIKWTHRSEELVQEYQGFLLDLCSAHNYYTKFAIEQLVLNFKGTDVEHPEWVDGKPSADEEVGFTRIHGVIKVLLLVIPMSQELLITSITNNFPFLKRGAQEHVSYIYNILRILQYKPNLRLTFLNLIINKLLKIDVQAPRAELEEEELDCDPDSDSAEVFTMEIETKDEPKPKPKPMKHPAAHALDQCMNQMFHFIKLQCYDAGGEFNWNQTKSFYSEMTQVFENIILPTHATHHVQFLLFYLLSLKNTLSYSFLQLLWRKVANPNVPPIIRQAGAAYIASLLARARFIPVAILKEMLADLTSWIHGYISNQDGLEINCDCRIHGVFYSVCQALFYLVAFRHKELVHHNKGLIFLQGLNLAKVVTCRLNPLRVCTPAVTSHFASITRHYQLAYCYSIIEHNARNTIPLVYRDSTGAATTCTQIYLDSYFPFDPYLLHSSNEFIKPIYREYDGTLPEESNEDKHQVVGTARDDEDDFLMEQTSAPNSCTLSSFSYGTSPGFLQM